MGEERFLQIKSCSHPHFCLFGRGGKVGRTGCSLKLDCGQLSLRTNDLFVCLLYSVLERAKNATNPPSIGGSWTSLWCCRLASSPLAHTPLSVLTPQAGEGDSFESVKSALVSLLSSLSLLTLFELLCLAGMILDSRWTQFPCLKLPSWPVGHPPKRPGGTV